MGAADPDDAKERIRHPVRILEFNEKAGGIVSSRTRSVQVPERSANQTSGVGAAYSNAMTSPKVCTSAYNQIVAVNCERARARETESPSELVAALVTGREGAFHRSLAVNQMQVG